MEFIVLTIAFPLINSLRIDNLPFCISPMIRGASYQFRVDFPSDEKMDSCLESDYNFAMNPNFCMPKELIPHDNKVFGLIEWISERAINGRGPFLSAEDLAYAYVRDTRLKSNAERIKMLIRWESTKNFGTGFLSGLGGFGALPATVTASLGASWVVQARLAGAVASIYGHDVHDERIRMMVMLALIGNAAKEELARLGIEMGRKVAHNALRHLSAHIVTEINRRVGVRLVTQSTQRSIVCLSKLVPVAGLVVGGVVDGVACRAVGKVADMVFSTDAPDNAASV